MKSLDLIEPAQLVLIATALGLLLTIDLDINEQNVFGNFFITLGQAILTNATQAENLNTNTTINDDIGKQIERLSNQLANFKKDLKID